MEGFNSREKRDLLVTVIWLGMAVLCTLLLLVVWRMGHNDPATANVLFTMLKILFVAAASLGFLFWGVRPHKYHHFLRLTRFR